MNRPLHRDTAAPVAERPAPVREPAAPAPVPVRAVTWRSVLLGLLLIPPNAYWLVRMERVRYSAQPTTISLTQVRAVSPPTGSGEMSFHGNLLRSRTGSGP